MNAKTNSVLTPPGDLQLPLFQFDEGQDNPARPTLANLRQRLLRETLEEGAGAVPVDFLRLVAVEAEAQAWLTAAPLLTFPLLFEEKVSAAKTYLARQQRLWVENPRAG